MKSRLLVTFLLIAGLTSRGQQDTTALAGLPDVKFGAPHNIVKLNLTGLAFKTFGVQYERVLNRKTSVALGISVMPSTTLPFKDYFKKYFGDDQYSQKVLEETKFSNFSITPEFRLYLSKKGYGRGFYLAPYYRYASFGSDLVVFYEDDNGQEQQVTYRGDITSHSVGLLLGSQFRLGQRLTLDWHILGGHVGKADGDFESTYTDPMSEANQETLRETLEGFDPPMSESEVEVESNRSALRINGGWAGIRAGFSLGFRF